MAVTNAVIAETLRRYASILALQGENRFKFKAYRRAAETIEALDPDISHLIRSGSDLTTLPGIGSGISAAIDEIGFLELLPAKGDLSDLHSEILRIVLPTVHQPC